MDIYKAFPSLYSWYPKKKLPSFSFFVFFFGHLSILFTLFNHGSRGKIYMRSPLEFSKNVTNICLLGKQRDSWCRHAFKLYNYILQPQPQHGLECKNVQKRSFLVWKFGLASCLERKNKQKLSLSFMGWILAVK